PGPGPRRRRPRGRGPAGRAGDRGSGPRLAGVGVEVEGQGVDAVALPGGRGAVVEDMAEVAAAALAQHLDAGHEVALVDTALDVRLVLGLPEARPARTGV